MSRFVHLLKCFSSWPSSFTSQAVKVFGTCARWPLQVKDTILTTSYCRNLESCSQAYYIPTNGGSYLDSSDGLPTLNDGFLVRVSVFIALPVKRDKQSRRAERRWDGW